MIEMRQVDRCGERPAQEEAVDGRSFAAAWKQEATIRASVLLVVCAIAVVSVVLMAAAVVAWIGGGR